MRTWPLFFYAPYKVCVHAHGVLVPVSHDVMCLLSISTNKQTKDGVIIFMHFHEKQNVPVCPVQGSAGQQRDDRISLI